MTLAELLALIGRSWSRLLVYPGGLSLLLAVMLANWLSSARKPAAQFRRLYAAIQNPTRKIPDGIVLAAPWLAIALLPLPGAVDLGKGLDMVVACALLDVPLFVKLWAELHGDTALRKRGALRLAAVLNLYPALLLAVFLLASAAGSLELGQIANAPPQLERAFAHWIGVIALLLILPAMLGIGMFGSTQPPTTIDLPLQFRAIGYGLLTLLPLLTLLSGPWQVVPPCLLALALWAFHRTTGNLRPRRFARAYFALALLQLGALFMLAAWQLSQRLR